jgi:3-oxoacid CoA-transferase A subunit
MVITEGKERREFDGQVYVLESPLRLDYALIYAHKADRAGNVSFRGTSQNFGPSFAKGAKTVIVEVDELVEVGEIDPGAVDLPGIFVDRVVRRERRAEPLWRIPR